MDFDMEATPLTLTLTLPFSSCGENTMLKIYGASTFNATKVLFTAEELGGKALEH